MNDYIEKRPRAIFSLEFSPNDMFRDQVSVIDDSLLVFKSLPAAPILAGPPPNGGPGPGPGPGRSAGQGGRRRRKTRKSKKRARKTRRRTRRGGSSCRM